MEARAQIPVSLPHPNPTISYWQDPPDAEVADHGSRSPLPEGVVDTLIVGSGITGAGVAWGLLGKDNDDYVVGEEKRDKRERVIMLEARQACSGATGRNGGHTKAASYRSFPSNVRTHSLRTAILIAQLEYANIKAVHAFARKHSIDCDLFSGDTVDIIYSQAQWDNAAEAVEQMRGAMPNDLQGAASYKVWGATETKKKFFVADDFGNADRPGYGEVKGAVTYEAGSLSAYKFVIGVLKMCLKAGLELHTSTPVLKLSQGSDGIWDVLTDRGSVRAKRVILATNGYTARLCPIFQGSIVPLRGQITAHRPGSNMPAGGLETTYSFVYENGYEYMIPRPRGSKFEGDIVIGGGLVHAKNEGVNEFGTTDDTTLNKEISEYLTGTTKRYFAENWGEDDKQGRVRREWTGVMGYSGDGFPFVGEVPGTDNQGLWAAASFQGHGMVLCWMCAKALVAMMRGNEEGLEWFPNVFRVSDQRLGVKFQGRLHTRADIMEITR